MNIPVSTLPPWPYLMFFVINFYIIEYGTEFLFFIAFLWSISVEEQFYLLWSLFMKFTKIRFDLFCWTLILISLAFRYYYLDDSATLYFHTVSTLGNFGIGGLLAWFVFNNSRFISRVTSILNKSSVVGSRDYNRSNRTAITYIYTNSPMKFIQKQGLSQSWFERRGVLITLQRVLACVYWLLH